MHSIGFYIVYGCLRKYILGVSGVLVYYTVMSYQIMLLQTADIRSVYYTILKYKNSV